MNGTGSLIKEALERSLTPPRGRTKQEGDMYDPEKREPSSDTKSSGAFILDFLASKNCEKQISVAYRLPGLCYFAIAA